MAAWNTRLPCCLLADLTWATTERQQRLPIQSGNRHLVRCFFGGATIVSTGLSNVAQRTSLPNVLAFFAGGPMKSVSRELEQKEEGILLCGYHSLCRSQLPQQQHPSPSWPSAKMCRSSRGQE
jgi:hypothetical protein